LITHEAYDLFKKEVAIFYYFPYFISKKIVGVVILDRDLGGAI
jgi:hypothetical protein